MILTFGSVSEGVAVAMPGLLALAAYVMAALLPQRAQTGVRASLVVAWLAHALAIAVDTSGVGTHITGAAQLKWAFLGRHDENRHAPRH